MGEWVGGDFFVTNLCLQSHFAASLLVGARLKTELARLQVALHLVQVEQLKAALVGARQGHQAHQTVEGDVWRVHHSLLQFKLRLNIQLSFIPAYILYTFADWQTSTP